MQAYRLGPVIKGFWARCCLCLMVVVCPSVFAQDGPQDESLLKVAFIYNFAKFTRWPASAWNGHVPLNLCTAGEDELVSSLQYLGHEMIKGRPVTIKAFGDGDGNPACHVLYIAASEHDDFARLIEQTRDLPVLTISEIRGFADAGGMIQLYRARNRVRFKINPGVADARGLRLSARLLDLAERVDGGVAP